MVEINIPPGTPGLRVNATPTPDKEGIITSEFNLTTPGSVPLVIRITTGILLLHVGLLLLLLLLLQRASSDTNQS